MSLLKNLQDKAIKRRENIYAKYGTNYNTYRPSEEEILKFYKSSQWRHVRQVVLNRDNYIDQLALTEENKIISGNTVHHILPLRYYWDLRLDFDNLETTSKISHNKEHKEKGQGQTNYQKIKQLSKTKRELHVIKFNANDELL